MNGYTKLFGSILASSVWGETKETKILWITILAMADKNGFVAASVPGLAVLARLTDSETQEALAVLEAPDPHSRTPAYDGRRIKKTDGGWKVLNHLKYRNARKADERREYLREKQAERRAKLKSQQPSTVVAGSQQNETVRSGGQQGTVDTENKHSDGKDLEEVAVNNRQQKSTSQPRQRAEAEANHTKTTGCPGPVPKCEQAGGNEALINLALLDWPAAIRYAEAAARRVPPSATDRSRRHWLKYGAMAAAMFGEGWLVGAGEGVKNCTLGTRETPQAHFVGILKSSALEQFGVDAARFEALRDAIEIPFEVYNSEALGGPRKTKKALAKSA